MNSVRNQLDGAAGSMSAGATVVRNIETRVTAGRADEAIDGNVARGRDENDTGPSPAIAAFRRPKGRAAPTTGAPQ